MSTQTAPGTGGGADTPAAHQPISLARDIQGRVRTCRPARTDRESEDPVGGDWHIILGED